MADGNGRGYRARPSQFLLHVMPRQAQAAHLRPQVARKVFVAVDRGRRRGSSGSWHSCARYRQCIDVGAEPESSHPRRLGIIVFLSVRVDVGLSRPDIAMSAARRIARNALGALPRRARANTFYQLCNVLEQGG